MQLCLSDIPEERILKLDNGKSYVLVKTYDYKETDERDNDFSVSLALNKEEQELQKQGQKVNHIFIGNGKIWD